MQGSESWISLLILLAVFVVLPQVLKLMARYNLKHMPHEQSDAESAPGYETPREPTLAAGRGFRDRELMPGEAHQEQVANTPIKPKWF